jgi:hypothetical protein
MKRRRSSYLYCLAFFLGCWGCVQGSAGTSSSELDAHGAAEVHADATLQPGSLVPPAECVVAEGLAEDPLRSAGSTEPITEGQKHLTDIDYDPESGLIVGSGMPGLALMRATEGAPENLGSSQKGKDHVEILSVNVVAVSSRGKSGKNGNELKGAGVSFVDISNPAQPQQISIAGAGSYLPISGASGMEYREPYLYVGTHDGKFLTIDAGNPSEASVISEVEGLGSPWQMVIHGDWAYVADNSKGIVSVNLSDPTSPVVGSSVSLGGGVQDVDVSDGVLYAAAGSAGLFALSLDDPSTPVVLGTASTGGAAISVSADDGYAWVTNQESVLVYDVSEPADLIPLGVEDTPSWAMHVVADGNRAFVADWKEVTTFVYTVGSMAPDADVELSSIYFTGGDETREFRVTNRGGADLVVHGLGTQDPRFSVEVDTLTVAPGDAMQVTLTFTSDGAEVSDTLCLSTNDPDEPLQEIELASTSSGSNILIGEAAPDFMLAGLDGANYTLSSMKGKPIVLCFFASW